MTACDVRKPLHERIERVAEQQVRVLVPHLHEQRPRGEVLEAGEERGAVGQHARARVPVDHEPLLRARDRVGEFGGLGGIVEREAAHDHEVRVVERGTRGRVEADAATLRSLVELVTRLAVGAVGHGPRSSERRRALDESHAVVPKVGANALGRLVVAEHRDERHILAEEREAHGDVQRRTAHELTRAARIA